MSLIKCKYCDRETTLVVSVCLECESRQWRDFAESSTECW